MEPQHYLWTGQHFRNNGLDPSDHMLIHAAVSNCDGHAVFIRDSRPDEEYGLNLHHTEPDISVNEDFCRKLIAHNPMEEVRATPMKGAKLRVPCISLTTIVEVLDSPIDFMHMDIQGEELRALEALSPLLRSRIRRLLVATHSRCIHRKVRYLLKNEGWEKVWDFGFRKREMTPFGDVQFLDGLLAFRSPAI